MPAVSWLQFKDRLPAPREVEQWWGNGREHGLALIMGRISGHAEMTEIEGRACDSDSLARVQEALRAHDATHIWEHLLGPQGYSEMSPYGGIHLIYRVVGGDVPGNTKVATRPPTPEELDENPKLKSVVLAETRGEGGYVIVAPSSGLCHPSGEAWMKLAGEYGHLPTITWEQRALLHAALREALHIEPPPPPARLPAIPAPRQPMDTIGGVRPGDDFEARTGWEDQLLLGGAGWQVQRESGGTTYWTRPGRDPRFQVSATTGHDSGRDRLYVFSTSTEFPNEEPITKFRAYSLLHHGGDDSQAASQLARQGFGTRISRDRDIAPLPEFDPQTVIEGEPFFTSDDFGNADRLWARAKGEYHWVHEEKCYYRWNGKTWGEDHDGGLTRHWRTVTDKMLFDQDDEIRKWGSKSRSQRATTAALTTMRSVEGVTKSRSDFDPHRHQVNFLNGVLDLNSGQFGPHRPELLMTRLMGARYDPQAICPNWDRFIEQVLPDPVVRSYVQRAIGATLLGGADQRAIFLIHGPSGTGKSQFTEIMRTIFGDYGVTAAASTFKARVDSSGPSNDLHKLRGRRFVSTSETSEMTRFDEDLLKRISGRDTITSRALYQEHAEWTPECSLWIATNHAPKFNSDDDAMWRRVKLIPFVTRFGTDVREIPDYARVLLAPEVDGILNWILAGLREFREHGLQEPAAVTEAAKDQRLEGDSVVRFVDERVSDGALKRDDSVATRMRTSELYMMYLEWCRQCGERPLAQRRFTNRIESNLDGVSRVKSHGVMWYQGLIRMATHGFLGTILPPDSRL
jgi:P4 family phage/plasmid primase-like protien